MRSLTEVYFSHCTVSLVTEKVMIPLCLKEVENGISGIQIKLHFSLASPHFPFLLITILQRLPEDFLMSF